MNRFAVIVPDRRTVGAYRALFTGHGSAEDARIVVADMELNCGFLQVTAADASVEETKFAEGQRSAFARIHILTRITDRALDALDSAEAQLRLRGELHE